jgi:uncharacterized membrane protein
MGAEKPKRRAMLRTPRERVIQTLAYEAGGLLIATPLYALIFGHGAQASLILMAAISAACLIWAPIHNTIFDLADYRFTGRVASDRPHRLRILQAASHETTSIAVCTPVVMWVGGHGFLDALMIDLGLTALYVAYAYVFHIIFDRLRPMREAHASLRADADDAYADQCGAVLMLDGHGSPADVLDNDYYLRKLLYDLPRMMGHEVVGLPQLVRAEAASGLGASRLNGFALTAHGYIALRAQPAAGRVTIDMSLPLSPPERERAVTLLKHAFRLGEAQVRVHLRRPPVPEDDVALSA